MEPASNRKKVKTTSTWSFFKAALSDQFQKKSVKFASAAGLVICFGLAFGANSLFQGSTNRPSSDTGSDSSDNNNDEPTASTAKTNSPSEKSTGSAARTLASVSGAVHSTNIGNENPSVGSANPFHNDASSEHHDHFDAPKPKIGNNPNAQEPSQPQALWNAGNNTGAPSNSASADHPPSSGPTTNGSTGSADQTSGTGGIASSGIPNTAPSPTASNSVSSAVSSVGAYENFGHVSTATPASAGFAVVAGGSFGTGTGMQITATIGQTTSPNVQNGTGLTLVSGLAGPVMVNF